MKPQPDMIKPFVGLRLKCIRKDFGWVDIGQIETVKSVEEGQIKFESGLSTWLLTRSKWMILNKS